MSSKPFENPLTPNKLLREMYLAMLEVRYVAKSRSKAKPSIRRGLEAMWVAPAIGLRGHAEDLASDPGAGPALDLALGAKLNAVLGGGGRDKRRLAPVGKPVDRLHCALGAAMAVRSAGQKGVVLAYAHPSELTASEWSQIFKASVDGELPILFVILPQKEKTAAANVSGIAHKVSLPAIPVDAADPIALYRVAQESIVRARAGGGPALIAGISLNAIPAARSADPLEVLSRQLLQKKACTPAWLARAEQRTRGLVAANPL